MALSNDLTCPLCRKCSDNKKAHIRHTSYCRNKAKRPPRPRKRSCLACIKAKSHCDVIISPRCSRCKQKGIECKLEQIQQKDAPVITRSEPSSTIDVDSLCSSDASSFSQCESMLVGWNDAFTSGIFLDETQNAASSQVDQMIVRQNLQLPMATVWNRPATFSILSAKDGVPNELPHNPISDQWNRMNHCTLGPQLSLRPVKAFARRGATGGPFSLLVKYMAQTIRQYPYMMLSDECSSPFIHHICLTENKTTTHKNGPGPLARCAAIVDLWRHKSPSNASYLWKILRIEQERLMQEALGYDYTGAINALQAITIYFLLRVSSAEDEDTDFDVPLIQTMSQLSLRVQGCVEAFSDPTSPIRPSIHRWIKAESLRRTIAALFIVDLLYDISPGKNYLRCDTLNLWSEMLLPCSRQLWEAKSQAEWTHQYDVLSDDRPYYGELLQHQHLDSARSSLLDRWMENVDDFGRLVINIASVAEVAF